ncbi:glycoside hydrolase family 73 protein [Terrimonas rubra]|uniref:Glycoside hydrolase family 73 protein n=1 Tax=Terrimonas rubra TaxID=1035890 RepID=A0ABW6AB68_9BACT
MTKQDFVNSFKPFAIQTQEKTGIDARFILAQAALESGWGKVSPGNMFFGVKDTDGINGNEQLLTTTEYSRSANLKFPVILSVTPVIRNGQKWFKYKVKDYFRKFDTPEQSFTHHANFFLVNKRYANALKVKENPYDFADEVAKAGYATDPDYSKTLRKLIKSIDQYF